MVGAFVVSQYDKDPREILFQTAADAPSPIPSDQLALKDDIDRTLLTLKLLFGSNNERFFSYYWPLLSLAQGGLVGPAAQPEAARRQLVQLQNELTAREGGIVKNRYMKLLGKHSLILGTPSLLLAVVFCYLTDRLVLSNFFFLWTGCMAGVWISFGARKTSFTFEDLGIPEKDRMEPVVRLVFAGLLTVIMGLLFSTAAIVVKLGAISTEQINNNLEVAILLGMLCGFSEQALSLTVSQQASKLLELKPQTTA
jgi:hypothetical protein